MKHYRTFVFNENDLQYVIISKQYDNEIIKDFDLYYVGNQKDLILGVLRHFDGKTINYTDFIEKFVIDATNNSQDVLRYSRTVLDGKMKNVSRYKSKMLDFLVSQLNNDWGLVNWNDFKRKERKNNKKKTSD